MTIIHWETGLMYIKNKGDMIKHLKTLKRQLASEKIGRKDIFGKACLYMEWEEMKKHSKRFMNV